MSSGHLRIGWIGCGTHASEMLLPHLVRLGVQLTAICDVDSAKTARIGLAYGVPDADRSGDWRSILARGDIDAIGIAAGPVAHAEIGKAVISRGLPLFLEKPPAPTAAAAAILAEAAAQAGVPNVVGFMKRYSTANRIAGNAIRAEGFGTAASFLGEYMTAPTYFAKDPDYSGFYLHHCVHYLDLVPYLMGPVSSLNVRRHELAPGKLLLHVDFRFRSGAIGTLVMGTHQSRGTPMEWWQVMGDHCRVEVRNVHEVRLFRNPPFKAGQPDAALVDGIDTLVWEPNLTAAANEDHKGYAAILADFVAIARGERRDAPDLADGARAMTLLEHMIAAASADRG
jgi:myo-inositol 2-dehydrogenase/D-chiro-inositol 1-dehydrogenase